MKRSSIQFCPTARMQRLPRQRSSFAQSASRLSNDLRILESFAFQGRGHLPEVDGPRGERIIPRRASLKMVWCSASAPRRHASNSFSVSRESGDVLSGR